MTKPFGNLVADIGGGTTDVAVISMAGAVVSTSVKVAGDNFNQAIMNYVRKNHSLLLARMLLRILRSRLELLVRRRLPELWR